MKKGIRQALSGVFLFGLFTVLIFSLSLSAYASPHLPTFELTDVDCAEGEEVTVYVKLNNAAGLEAGQAKVLFDDKLLEFIRAEETEDATGAGLLVDSVEAIDGVFPFAFIHAREVKEEHDEINIYKIVFKAKAQGQGRLELDTVEYYSSKSEDDIASSIDVAFSDVKISKSDPSKSLENGVANNYGTLLLVGGIVVVAAIGIVVIVTVLSRKKSDVNPNKIDMKKE